MKIRSGWPSYALAVASSIVSTTTGIGRSISSMHRFATFRRSSKLFGSFTFDQPSRARGVSAACASRM